MKGILFPLLLVLILTKFEKAAAQTKHAIIFAIGNYPEEGGWSQISSTKDVPFIDRTLQKQGFLPANIKKVVDEQATKAGIVKALTDLIASVKPGDIVTIHFSSHGEQVEDDNGDEADGLDETIVSYEAVVPYKSKDFKKDQASYFRDDEFGNLISQLRTKLGKNGDVLVLMDACHSGSGTRGVAKVRGNVAPFVSKDFDKKKFQNKETADVFQEGNATRGNESALATYIVIAAARAEELNSETFDENKESMGSLTYAVSKVFENLDPGVSYRSLFSRIQVIMNEITPGQHPVMEGNGAERSLFGGKYVEQKPYIDVESLKGTDMILKGGKLAGLDAGAKVAIHVSGTNDPGKAKALAAGTITKADNYSATVKLDNSPGSRNAAGYWVFITEPVFNIKPVTIGFAAPTRGQSAGYSASEQAAFKTALKDMPLVKFEGTPDLLITKGANRDSIKIASNGYLFNTVSKTGATQAEIQEELKRYSQYRFLHDLAIKDDDAYVDVKFIPVYKGKPDTTRINSKIVGGVYEFAAGDTMVLWVKNTGHEAVYVNILDMQPDGIINPILPNKAANIHPYDLKIPGKSSRIFSKYSIVIGPPYGTEVFKVFVSKEEINMEVIANSMGAKARGNFGLLEKVVQDSYNVSTRGATGMSIGNADGSAYNVLFRIKPKRKS